VTQISSEIPDWSREAKPLWVWVPGRSLLASIRYYQRCRERKGPLAWLGRKLAILRYRWWSIVTGAEIPLNAKLGGGLLIPHPNGIVIHPDSAIGPNGLIFQQVTIGTRAGKQPPVIGGHVDIGAGAKIIGPVTIGDHAKIGANAVVLHDVPPGMSAVGIPATIIKPKME